MRDKDWLLGKVKIDRDRNITQQQSVGIVDGKGYQDTTVGDLKDNY